MIDTEISIRQAQQSDMDWVNNQYKIIGFKKSIFEQEDISIAEVDGKRAGLGRLQKIETESAELGRIYVLESYRSLGLARQIVTHLMNYSSQYKKIYCIPFAHLQNFYMRFGFEIENKPDTAPTTVSNKLRWCASEYDDKTVLLIKDLSANDSIARTP